MRRILLAFLPALLLTHIVGSVLATQLILAEVRRMGVPVTLPDRLLVTAQDIVGLAGSYLPLLLPTLAAAFCIAVPLGRWLPLLRGLLYPLSGALAVLGLHHGARELLGFSPLAATREDIGMALQAAAGWVGGYAFLLFTGQARR